MERQALLIGVSHFDDKRLNALNAPADDIAKLAEVLKIRCADILPMSP
jgi:hypothetical protein